MPVDFAASGVDAMTLTAHKLGGPYGVGALVVRRELDPTPLLHGGGQERGIRSGHPRRPGDRRASPSPSSWPSRSRPTTPRGSPSCATSWCAGCSRWSPTRGSTVDPVDRLPGHAHLSFPGCEGDSLLMLLDHRGIECSTGSACSAGVPQPSHVLLAMGRDEAEARSSLRFTLGRTSTPADVEALAEAIGPVVERARAASPMRVVAAMSGGVDSAVAAARAVEAGHEVTGIHLALSRNPRPTAPAPAAAARSRTPTTPAGRPTSSGSPSTSGT